MKETELRLCPRGIRKKRYLYIFIDYLFFSWVEIALLKGMDCKFSPSPSHKHTRQKVSKAVSHPLLCLLVEWCVAILFYPFVYRDLHLLLTASQSINRLTNINLRQASTCTHTHARTHTHTESDTHASLQ